MIHPPFGLQVSHWGFGSKQPLLPGTRRNSRPRMGRVEREFIPTNRFGWKEVLKSGCVVYSFSHNHGSGKWLYLKGSYYWRDPFLTSMIMGGSVELTIFYPAC